VLGIETGVDDGHLREGKVVLGEWAHLLLLTATLERRLPKSEAPGGAALR
jgi:hypothetical protein